jgi:hypothetical protein
MKYEIHLTTGGRSDPHGSFPELWREECKSKGFKPLHIQLSQGQYADQLMCGINFEGTEREALYRAGEIAGQLTYTGWPIIRAKVESPVFQSVDNAYFECHWKYPLTVEPSMLSEICRMCPDFAWSQELYHCAYYLTCRIYNAEVAEFDGYYDYLAKNGLGNWDKVHSELVLLDTNPGLDVGWFTKKAAANA